MSRRMKTEEKHTYMISAILLQIVIKILCLEEKVGKHLSIGKLPFMIVLATPTIMNG